MTNWLTTLRWLLPLLVGWSATGCSAGAKQYWVNRGRDVRDIIDWDYGVGPGLAVKLELTHFLAPSVGFLGASETQTAGREVDHDAMCYLVSFGVVGLEAAAPHAFELYFTAINVSALAASPGPPRLRNWFRVGPKLGLAYVSAGFYVNLAEMVDFLGGWMGFDLMHDDETYYPVEDPWEVGDDPMSVGFELPKHLPALPECTILALQTGMARNPRLQAVASAAAARIIGERAAGDEVGLVWFGSQGTSRFPESGEPLACDENDKAVLLEVLGRIPPGRDGSLPEGIEAAIELARASIARTKAIVVFTSGQGASTDRGDDAFFLQRAARLAQAAAGELSIHVVLIGPARNDVGVFLEALMAETHGKLVRSSSTPSGQRK